jgi:pSer/pThr/pTyr-binding forkhead associated (FHA) protein
MSLEWTLLALRLLAVAVLYAFLAAVIAVIWRDLRAAGGRTDRSPEESAAPGGRLRVLDGEDAPPSAGETFALAEHMTLGRAADNTITLPDTYASAYHARLDQRDGEWWLTDLDSRNGTRLNDVPIGKPAPLADGDVIAIGQMKLRLEIGD